MSQDEQLHLYVLAGGRSSRFGSDKAFALIDGLPLIQRVIACLVQDASPLMPQASITLVTGKRAKYAELGYPVLTDQPSDIGPMGGLHAALTDQLQYHGPGWVLVASCDLVKPRRAWVDVMLAHRRGVGVTSIAFRGKRWEPMLALYHTDMIEIIKRQIAAKQYSLQALLDEAKTYAVDMPDGLRSLPQANTPGELQRLTWETVEAL